MLAEINSRVEGGEMQIYIPELEHAFYIDLRSDNLQRLLMVPAYETHVVNLVRAHLTPSVDFIDVGANVGFLTLFASEIIGENRHVLAIEPTPRALELLRRNIASYRRESKIIIIEGVATAEPVDTVPIHVVEGKEEYSSVNGIHHVAVEKEKSTTFNVKGHRVDDLVEQHNLKPGFIKVDTEGHEDAVFEGALRTIKTHSPVILTELSDRLLAHSGGARGVIQKLEALDYRVADAENLSRKIRFPFEGEIIATKK